MGDGGLRMDQIRNLGFHLILGISLHNDAINGMLCAGRPGAVCMLLIDPITLIVPLHARVPKVHFHRACRGTNCGLLAEIGMPTLPGSRSRTPIGHTMSHSTERPISIQVSRRVWRRIPFIDTAK